MTPVTGPTAEQAREAAARVLAQVADSAYANEVQLADAEAVARYVLAALPVEPAADARLAAERERDQAREWVRETEGLLDQANARLAEVREQTLREAEQAVDAIEPRGEFTYREGFCDGLDYAEQAVAALSSGTPTTEEPSRSVLRRQAIQADDVCACEGTWHKVGQPCTEERNDA